MGAGAAMTRDAEPSRFVLVEPSGRVRQVDRPWGGSGNGAAYKPGQVDRVTLPPPTPLVGLVRTDALRLGLDRNLAGGCLLVALGAPIEVYAGPVLIAGFDPQTTVPAGTNDRIRPLVVDQAAMLTGLAEDVAAAGTGLSTGRGEAWDARIRHIHRLIDRAPLFFGTHLRT